MGIRVALHHKTFYRYDRPVALSPQIVRFRPAVLSKNSIVLGFEEDSAFRPRGSLPECKRVWIHLTFSSSLSPVG